MVKRILSVVGARPNFVKIAPVLQALGRNPGEFELTLVHTGQHYDGAMSQVFFDQLAIPRPDINLDVRSGSHAAQTAGVMAAFEPVMQEARPDLVVVVGDVNSTLACALVAAKAGVAVAHVEAGLRSFDRTMPEELNRVLTDHLSALLFTTEPSAGANLEREGIDAARVHFVGNVMIDTLLSHREAARTLGMPGRFGLEAGRYAVLTLHRPAHVEAPEVFERLMAAVAEIAVESPIVFPLHPRTRRAVLESPTAARVMGAGRLMLLDPLGYLDFIGLVDSACAVLTDSGGVQEETTVLGVPCLTLRTTTERPVTLTEGTNQLVGLDPDAILKGWRRIPPARRAIRPALWDGRAAERIADVLRSWAPGDDPLAGSRRGQTLAATLR